LTITLALIVPPIWTTYAAAARAQSINNLKDIALAAHSFHDVNKRLPFNGSDLPFKDIAYRAEAGSSNSNSGSWAFQILPYLGSDECRLYNAGGQQNNLLPADARTKGILRFMCPGRGRQPFEDQGGAWTD